MPKKCNDPVCPANKDKSKKKKPKKSKKKERKEEEESKQKKDKNSSSEKYYKNKKCQVTKSMADCSTSTQPLLKPCITRKEAARPSPASTGISRDSSPSSGQTICHCKSSKNNEPCECKPREPSLMCARSRAKSRERARQGRRKERRCVSSPPRKESEQPPPDECFRALCICVRNWRSPASKEESRTCKCAEPCAALSKDVCCCAEPNGTIKHTKEQTPDSPKRSLKRRFSKSLSERPSTSNGKKKAKCVCEKPPVVETETPVQETCSRKNMFTRGLYSVHRKVKKSTASLFRSKKCKPTFECAPCEKSKKLPDCPNNCPTDINCGELPPQNRCYNTNVKKKVRMSK